jgi:ABC-2 type transport system permease protein
MSRAADGAAVAVSPRPPSTIARLIGLGSIFGKGLRDSRRAAIAVGLFCGIFVMATAGAIASEFRTADSRIALVGSLASIPLIQGLLGPPVNVGTLGGVISWRVVSTLPLLVGIWSIVALSGTIAAEGRRGTLEFLATVPVSRRRLAIEKAAAHVVALASAMAILAFLTWLATVLFGTLPEDPVSPAAAIGMAIGVGLGALAAGAVAFAVAPFLGRSAAAGVGATVMFASYLVNGFSSTIVGLDLLRPLSYFAWTANHRPLAGTADWPPVIVLAACCLIALSIGTEAFARRDIGTTGVGRAILPRLHYGIGGPAGRSFADRLPIALAWATGLGLYGLLVSMSASTFAAQLGTIPGLIQLVQRAYPGADVTTSAGVLQLLYFSFAILMFGLAAATLVGGWASDEGDRRLEMVLSTPTSRLRWGLASGVGVMAAIAVLAGVVAALVAVGAIASGDDPAGPVIGVGVAGLYGGALAGIGLAVGGLRWPGLAAAVVGLLAIGFFLIDFFGALLKLPDLVLQLSLSAHLGRPLVGTYDIPGMVACAVLIVGGVAVAAVGLTRRDVGR